MKLSLPAEVVWRVVVAVAVGVAAGVAVGIPLEIAAGLLVGWGAAACVTVVWVVVYTWPMDAAQTRLHATQEDPGRRVSRFVAIIGSTASLGAVAIVLLQTRGAPIGEATALAAIAVFSVAASWFLIQTNYMLRYAHVYFSEPEGGIDFAGDDEPMYTDFIYFSVGLGMAYQVGDTTVKTNEIRRIVVGQTVLAWVFVTVIIATMLTLVVGLA